MKASSLLNSSLWISSFRKISSRGSSPPIMASRSSACLFSARHVAAERGQASVEGESAGTLEGEASTMTAAREAMVENPELADSALALLERARAGGFLPREDSSSPMEMSSRERLGLKALSQELFFAADFLPRRLLAPVDMAAREKFCGRGGDRREHAAIWFGGEF